MRRLALVGAGRIGAVHASNIAALPSTRLTWVCSRNLSSAQMLTSAFGGKATNSFEAVLAAGDVDGVVISSPNASHLDYLKAAVAAGVPVLCEKPLDLDIERVDAARTAVKAKGVFVAIGFNRRSDPHFAELRKRVATGEIGNLEQLVITSRDPEPPPARYVPSSGGIFRDMTIHDFDMARFFVPDIVAVSAHVSNLFSEEIELAGDHDSTVTTLLSASGQQVVIINSRHSSFGYDQRIEAFGSQGALHVANVGPSVVSAWSASGVETRPAYEHFFLERYQPAYRAQLEAFIRGADGERTNLANFDDGRAALILANAAEESARRRAVVTVNLD
jgi:myo-inositol 2-dehydrogenase / D-chiro-inositol 1-dehydrogenase